MTIALAVVAIIAGLIIIVFQASGIRQLKTNIENEKHALDLSNVHLIQRRGYQSNAVIYQERYDRLKLKIPDSPKEEEILRLFYNIGQDHGMRITEILFIERIAQQEMGYIEMLMTVNMEGRFRDLPDTLSHIRRSDRAIRIDNITIMPLLHETALMRISLRASAFYLLGD